MSRLEFDKNRLPAGFGSSMPVQNDTVDYFFDTNAELDDHRLFVLIIYDIVENNKRNRFARYLQGYGKRVQKSAFEARLSKKAYNKLIREIPGYIGTDDNVRVYRINGSGQIKAWGYTPDEDEDEIILI